MPAFQLVCYVLSMYHRHRYNDSLQLRHRPWVVVQVMELYLMFVSLGIESRLDGILEILSE